MKLEEIFPQAVEDRLLFGVELEARKVVFKKGLSRAQSLDDVRLLVQKQELGSSQAPALHTLALQHILQSQWSLGEVKDFLLDPILNPPGAQPFRVLGNALRADWLDQTTRAGLFDVICQCVSLGIASPEVVKYIITSIPRFKMPRETALVRLSEEPTIHEYYRKILSAIQESKVISIEDLGSEFVLTWFKDISNCPFAPTATYLLWELRHYSGQSERGLAIDMLFRLFPHALQDDTVAVQGTELGKFLALLPTAMLPYVLIKATQSVLSSSKHATDQDEHLPILRWHDLLAGLSDRKVQHIFASTEAWRECLSEPGPVNERAQRAVIASWVAVSMSKRMRQAEGQLKKLKFGNVFKELYSDSNRIGAGDALAQFLETLQSLPLPNTSLLLSRLRFVTDDFLVVHNKDFILRATEKNLLRRFSLLQNDHDYDHFRVNFNDALVDLAESVNNDLTLFLHVSRYFIEKDESAFRIIVRILKHNLALHNTLSQSWPTRVARHRASSEAPYQLTAEQAHCSSDGHQHSPSVGHSMDALKIVNLRPTQRSRQSPQLDPRKVLDLMNHLAISFATSPVIKPRQAVRRVYWCFEMLHRYGAPIESPITRALWYAGITRQGENGTANTILRWIVQQIRIVEGDNIADMLIRSAGFRQKVDEQFADLKWLDHDAQGDDTDEIMLGELQKYESIDHEATVLSHEPLNWRKEDTVMTTFEFESVWRPVSHETIVEGREKVVNRRLPKTQTRLKDQIGIMRPQLK